MSVQHNERRSVNELSDAVIDTLSASNNEREAPNLCVVEVHNYLFNRARDVAVWNEESFTSLL